MDDKNQMSNTRKRGWAGDDMEMEHRREQLRNSDFNSNQHKHGIVDFDQFRNKEVGVGYQARGVVRQRGGYDAEMKIIDMTKSCTTKDIGKNSIEDDEDNDSRSLSRERRRESKKKKKSSKKSSGRESDSDRRDKKKKKRKEKDDDSSYALETYLQCKGLRDFRKEIEKIFVESKLK